MSKPCYAHRDEHDLGQLWDPAPSSSPLAYPAGCAWAPDGEEFSLPVTRDGVGKIKRLRARLRFLCHKSTVTTGESDLGNKRQVL